MPNLTFDERDDAQNVLCTGMPQVGERLRIALDNRRSRVIGATKTTRFAGRVVPLPHYNAPDEFGLYVEGSPAPLRAIRLSRCWSINGVRVHAAPAGPAPVATQRTRVIDVPGSKGNMYQVRVNSDGSKTCTCVGFGFRHYCKHVEQVK